MIGAFLQSEHLYKVHPCTCCRQTITGGYSGGGGSSCYDVCVFASHGQEDARHDSIEVTALQGLLTGSAICIRIVRTLFLFDGLRYH